MPPLPAQPSTLAVELKHTYSNDTDVQVKQFWQYAGTAPTDAELNTFSSAVEAAWASHVAPLSSSDVVLVEVVSTDLTSDTASRGTWTGSTAGSVGTAPLSAQDCFLQGFTVARRYRGGKPRSYWPLGVAADLLDPQHWTSGFLSSVETGLAAYATAIEGAGWSGAGSIVQVNVSYYNGFKIVGGPYPLRTRNIPLVRGSGAPAGPVIPPDVITGATYSPLLATQRRRTTRKR